MSGEPDRPRGPATPAQLLVYGFAPGAEFEGQLVGAIERIERGGTLRTSPGAVELTSGTGWSSFVCGSGRDGLT